MISESISAEFCCNIKYVWQTVTSLTEYSWRSEVKNIVVSPDKRRFEEYTKDGFVTRFKITKFKPYDSYEFEIENDNLTGYWRGKFIFRNGCTFVNFTEEVSAKKFYIKPFLRMYVKSRQKIYIADLKRALKRYEDIKGKKQK